MASLFLPPLSRVRLVGVLAVTQVIGWGTTFDMPGVMVRLMAPDVGLTIDGSLFGLMLMMPVIFVAVIHHVGLAATATLGLALMAAALASWALLAKLLRSPVPLADRIETS